MSPEGGYGGRVLEHFNNFAEFKTMATHMWLLLEEIYMLIDCGQDDGLQAKCTVAIDFWVTWIEWNQTHNNEFEPGDPTQLQISEMLNAGLEGCEPAEIRRRLQRLRDDNGWPADSAPALASDRVVAWRN